MPKGTGWCQFKVEKCSVVNKSIENIILVTLCRKKFFFMNDFISDSQSDWTENNLAVLRELVREAYLVSAEGIRGYHPSLASNPNRPYAQGYMRWVTLDGLLFKACEDGRLPGITANFKPNKSGPQSLELVGAETRTLVVHLTEPDDCPPRSDLREQARECNQALFSFMRDSESAAKAPIQLLFVHSGEGYAGLRAYYDSENPSLYHPITGNIMDAKLPVPVFETEMVTESNPELTVILPMEKAGLAAAAN